MSRNSGEELFHQASSAWDAGEFELAYKLFISASNKGDIGSMVNVGYFLDEGIGVDANKVEALRWYRRAAIRGNASGRQNLAILYRELGNIRQAKKWFLKSLEAGDDDAALHLAKIYLQGRTTKSQKWSRFFLEKTITSDQVDKDDKKEARILLKQQA